MQAHRKNDSGSVYSLDLTDKSNESRNRIMLNAQNEFKPLFCRHCDKPECVSSCMSGALTKKPDTGLVMYDADKCAACFMCVMNCSFGVIKMDYTKTKVVRCDFCAQYGGEPNCVKACRGGALSLDEVGCAKPNPCATGGNPKKHVIIGAGAAGVSAAKTIREINSTDEIVIISADESVYSRCMLHNYINGQRDEKKISFVDDDFFAKNNIRWVSGKAVTGVDAGKKEVCFADGTEAFDTLLIASGADSIELPVFKSTSPKNVLGLRNLSDAKAIRECAGENIVVIGAGLVGLDAAYALVDMDKKPVIIDMANQIMPLNLDSNTANVYKNKFEEAGCTFRLGQKVTAAETDASDSVTSLTLDTGEKLKCDMVIVAVGTTPATDFLTNSGIACDNGVTVNENLATSIYGIYAAGDATGLSGIWPNAMKQGEVAAKNMCGIKAVYDDTFAVKNTINYFGIQSLSLGKTEPGDGDTFEIRNSRDMYAKIILHDGCVVGVVLQGDIAHSGFWQYLIKNKVDVSRIKRPVFELSFADFYGVKDNGEYEWIV